MPGNGEEVATATSFGTADTSGYTSANRSLSQRLANAVIGYLVTKQDMNQQSEAERWGGLDAEPPPADMVAPEYPMLEYVSSERVDIVTFNRPQANDALITVIGGHWKRNTSDKNTGTGKGNIP
jgi:hypothetical protein